MSEIGDAIRHNDLPAYQTARYPRVPDGEILLLENEDFSGVDFYKFSMGFTVFRKCILDSVTNLYGQPIYMENCSARGIDLRSLSLILHATDTDFTGMLYDENTILAVPENGSPSTLKDCTVDSVAIEHLREQGVIIR